jgi:hypothetical protein
MVRQAREAISAGRSTLSGVRWVIGAGLLGFASSALLTSALHLPRDGFVAFHAVVVAVFAGVFVRSRGIDPATQLRRRWATGLVAGVLVGALLVWTVLRQPESARPGGVGLLWALAWDGALYGAVDAVLLTVIPVLAIYGARSAGQLGSQRARWRWGFAALLASIFITGAYHLGFAEFRGPALVAPLIGSTIITLSYLVTGSPVAPIISHMLMHAAAVVHGMATTVQLPPHY